MKWDGQAYKNVVKERLYSFLTTDEISEASRMSNNDYAAYLKKHKKMQDLAVEESRLFKAQQMELSLISDTAIQKSF